MNVSVEYAKCFLVEKVENDTITVILLLLR